ncbi:hypothetical protein [Pseudarthrobacter sp. S9]|uniref:hypothetical protein n=1 Tax=Pseudarthrobacter sp. S9 TaxID=3418421 RepID=UPI003D02FF45
MILYHFTSTTHLPRILESGYLKTVESNVSLKREHAGPDVVWLTTKTSADGGHGLQGSAVDKTAIRFTVDLDKRAVHKWKEWAKRQGSNEQVMDTLSRAGGSASWRLTTSQVPLEQWVEVRNMATGEVLLDREAIKRAIA